MLQPSPRSCGFPINVARLGTRPRGEQRRLRRRGAREADRASHAFPAHLDAPGSPFHDGDEIVLARLRRRAQAQAVALERREQLHRRPESLVLGVPDRSFQHAVFVAEDVQEERERIRERRHVRVPAIDAIRAQ